MPGPSALLPDVPPGEAQLPRRRGTLAHAGRKTRSVHIRGRQVSIVNFSRRWAAAAVLTVLAAGCGSSPAPVVRSPTTTPPPATTTAPAPPSATVTPSATAPSGHQKVTVTPATGLKSGQKALVQASGFSPGESLVVTECAAKGAATGPGDCDLNGMQSVTSDASGQVKVDLTLTKGPFGANNIVCGPTQACLISVTQATPSPVQEADTPITFGLPDHARRDGDQPGHDRDLRRAARRTGTRMRAAAATPMNTLPRYLAEVALRHLRAGAVTLVLDRTNLPRAAAPRRRPAGSRRVRDRRRVLHLSTAAGRCGCNRRRGRLCP